MALQQVRRFDEFYFLRKMSVHCAIKIHFTAQQSVTKIHNQNFNKN